MCRSLGPNSIKLPVDPGIQINTSPKPSVMHGLSPAVIAGGTERVAGSKAGYVVSATGRTSQPSATVLYPTADRLLVKRALIAQAAAIIRDSIHSYGVV